MFKNMKLLIAAFSIFASASVFAANPAQPFLPSDNVQDPNCTPADSNCYVTTLNATSTIVDGGNSSGNILTIGTNDNNALQFETNGTSKMTVLSDGNVGIGTTTPGANLEITGSSYLGVDYPILRMTGKNSALQFFSPTSGAAVNRKHFSIVHGEYFDNAFAATSTALVFQRRTDAGGFSSNLMSLSNEGRLTLDSSSATPQGDTKFTIGGDSTSLPQITLRSMRTSINTGNIVGGMNFVSNDSNLTAPGSTTANILAIANTTHTASALGTDLAFSVTNGTTMSEALRIIGNGNVGIGTSTPTAKLTVQSNPGDANTLLFAVASSTGSTVNNLFSISPSGAIMINRSGTASPVLSGGSDAQLSFQMVGSPGAQNTSIMYANGNANNILVGYSTPGTAAAPTASILNSTFIRIGGGGYTGTTYAQRGEISIMASENWSATSTGTDIRFNTTANGTISRTEKIRIDNAGSLGIGTTTPLDKLQVYGDIRVGTSSTNGCIKDFSGTGFAGTCSSDERLKTNVVDLSDGYLDKMAQLKTITYNWNDLAKDVNRVDTSVTNYGLLAQNVELVFPELVSTDSNGYKQVNYSRLPLYLLKAVQELNKKIAGLFDGTFNIFVNNAKIKNQLCIGNTCVTEQQLLQLLQNQGGGSAQNFAPTENRVVSTSTNPEEPTDNEEPAEVSASTTPQEPAE